MKRVLSALLFTLSLLSAHAQEPATQSASPATASDPRLDAFLATQELDRTRNKLSLLWTTVSLNMIGADVLSSYIPGAQEELEDFAGGKDNIKYFMLAGAVIYEIPIGMILASRYLPYNANRWTNVAAAGLTALTVIGGGGTEPHYLFLATLETLTCGYIAWTALTWKDPAAADKAAEEKKHDVGLKLDAKQGLMGLRYSYRF